MPKIRVRRHSDSQSEINIIPLLDVLLVLLLILMMTSPFITTSIKVDLPSVKNSKTFSKEDKNIPIIIEVIGAANYNLIINYSRTIHLSLKEIINQVKRNIIANPKTVFLIGGNKQVSYDEIIKVIILLRQVGVKSVGLMTKSI
ncbi:colicin uptake protein TolR [Pantoea sp. Aalb]|uniref:colicin uptake protein TolR n=1 Tax=Pantoea sp. Aalb TaxID=2576762 RepID=UPI0013230D3C|nr:colicin uptake protein TolR [Pantoea sp. Aalb]MXP67529.1 colicin uptake protein TolR [Pantoea sp. Aalb]